MRREDLISPNEDINENRGMALDLMKLLSKDAHVATKWDKDWFWVDMDTECSKEIAWEYVNYNFDDLCDKHKYIFRVTEWFSEFYRYMPECLHDHLDGAGQIDWNLFFSLAYPLPGNLGVPFHIMINKLNIAQLRLVKTKIVQEVYDDRGLRKSIFAWDVIPSIYTYYMPYQQIRKRVLELDRKAQRELHKESDRDLHYMPKPLPEILELHRLIQEGYTISSMADGKITLSQ